MPQNTPVRLNRVFRSKAWYRCNPYDRLAIIDTTRGVDSDAAASLIVNLSLSGCLQPVTQTSMPASAKYAIEPIAMGIP